MNQISGNNFILSPGYISGLTQTDGSFFCSIILSPKHRFGIQFRPKYSITADLDSKYVLDSIQAYFNCGKVTINIKKHTAEFVVSKLEDLNNIIIPHFNSYSVFCGKLHAFELLKKIVTALFNKEKRTLEERRELLKLALSMNKTNNRTIERIETLYTLMSIDANEEIVKESQNNPPLALFETRMVTKANSQRLELKEITVTLSDDFISGIIDGDGSFFISFQKEGKIKTGFNITNDPDSRPLLEKIKAQLQNIGSIQEGSKNELVYTVNGINQINDVLIPFIDKSPNIFRKSFTLFKF
uniref:Intronic protein n=1 Tax=Cyclocybe aegerita TaxID=1973307 RepID=Q9XKY9_CYCAE|nr:intronic protein [Cyclocybe aegerita]